MAHATIDAEQISSAAKKEPAVFPSAVQQVFGAGEIHRAADLWISVLEQTGRFTNAVKFRSATSRFRLSCSSSGLPRRQNLDWRIATTNSLGGNTHAKYRSFPRLPSLAG
jgi:hypothetical protein